MTESPLMNYRSQPTQGGPWLRRLARGFFVLALMSIALLVHASLQVMVSDLSMLPVNSRMMLMATARYGIWAIGVVAAIVGVAGYWLVTRYNSMVPGTTRGLSRVVVILLVWELYYFIVLPFSVSLFVAVIRTQRTVTMDEVSLISLVIECCAKAIHILALTVLTVAVVRVLCGQKLRRFAAEYWGIFIVQILFVLFEGMVMLRMHQAFTGTVSFSEAKKIMAITALGTLARMLMYVWMSVFFLRAWKAVMRAGGGVASA